MTAVLMTVPVVKFTDSSGAPLAGGKVYFYQAGTSTPKDTYTTAAGSIANTNPVILDSQGAAVIFLSGSYKINLTDSSGTQQSNWPVDNVTSFTTGAVSSTFSDGSFTIQNASDLTKQGTLDLSSLTTGTTSVQKWPTSNGTLLSSGTVVTVAQGGTGATTLTANNVILGNGTSAVQFVAPGTSGNVLSSNGTTWASSSVPNPITLSTLTATTSGTSKSFSSIPSTVKQITISFSGVSTNGTDALLIQIGDSGGIENSGYVSGSTYSSGGGVVSGTSTAGFIIQQINATDELHGSVVLTLMDAATNLWCAAGSLFSATGTSRGITVAGTKALSGTLDRLQITTTGGTNTFDAGSVNIAYI